ncbi:MAG: hypothetical protein ACOZF0_16645, partial [Thermodesulfobacteriota bacterium]
PMRWSQCSGTGGHNGAEQVVTILRNRWSQWSGIGGQFERNTHQPMDVSFLSQIGGRYWTLKYLQGSKAFDDEAAKQIEKEFLRQKADKSEFLPVNAVGETSDDEEADVSLSDSEVEELILEVPDVELQIMGTFQTVNFLNESDKLRGLESLVNRNFYQLFTQYEERRTILIPENRLFLSSGPKIEGLFVKEIRTIPDALLITFNKKAKVPIQISLVEYECYGETRFRPNDKSQYMNATIIPQLMRFASAFSIITDQYTRTETIKKWIDKIVEYTLREQDLVAKVDAWVKEIDSEISTRQIISFFEKKLDEAFRSNIHVYLIIDELSIDQRETIRNVIRSFKMDNGESIVFDASIVKLVQRITMMDHKLEFGLTVQ